MIKYIILFFVITGIYFASVQHLFMRMERDPFVQYSKQTQEANSDIIKDLTKIQKRQKKQKIEEEKQRKLALAQKMKEEKLKKEKERRLEKYAEKIIAKKLAKIEKMRQEALDRLEQIRLAKEKAIKDANAIVAKINISQQRMSVYKGNNLLYQWKVSTARKGYHTPRGKYTPKYMTKMHYSRKYHNSPMPYSIFFNNDGYAIHGTKSVNRLGSPASHGCVRLNTKDAKSLYNLVQKSGKDNTIIHIIN